MPQISFEVRDIYLFSFLVLIPASFYLWNIYDSRDYDYNDNLKIIIEESFEKNELIIIPIEETRYLYHYGLPNVYIWLYPNLEFRNLDKDLITQNTWTIDIKDINQDTFDLSVVNPNIEEEALPEPNEILKEIEKLEIESSKLLNEIKKIIK